MKVIFDLIASNSAWVTVAPEAVISLSITWFPTCGSYFVACVKTFNLTRVGFETFSVWSLISLSAASFATTKRVISTLSVQAELPLRSGSLPETMISLGASTSPLFVLVTSL